MRFNRSALRSALGAKHATDTRVSDVMARPEARPKACGCLWERGVSAEMDIGRVFDRVSQFRAAAEVCYCEKARRRRRCRVATTFPRGRSGAGSAESCLARWRVRPRGSRSSARRRRGSAGTRVAAGRASFAAVEEAGAVGMGIEGGTRAEAVAAVLVRLTPAQVPAVLQDTTRVMTTGRSLP